MHRRVRHGILTDFGYSLEVIRPVDFDEIDLPGFGVGRRIQLYSYELVHVRHVVHVGIPTCTKFTYMYMT